MKIVSTNPLFADAHRTLRSLNMPFALVPPNASREAKMVAMNAWLNAMALELAEVGLALGDDDLDFSTAMVQHVAGKVLAVLRETLMEKRAQAGN